MSKSTSMQEMSVEGTDSSCLKVGNQPQEQLVAPSPTNMRRNVSFAKVTVREYEQTLGDQPCSSGPPVSLGWDFHQALDANVEDYEAARQGTRRVGQEMKMPASVRVARLMEHGHTRNQINRTTVQSRKAMTGRMATANQTQAQFAAAQAWESLGRKMKRVVKGKKNATQSANELLALHDVASIGETALRQSCPEMRRVKSMGDFLGKSRANSFCTTQPTTLRGILKTSKTIAVVEPPVEDQGVEDSPTEDSDSDASISPPVVVKRSVSLNEEVLTHAVQATNAAESSVVDTPLEPADEDALYF